MCRREGGLTWKRHIFHKFNKQGHKIQTLTCQRCGTPKIQKKVADAPTADVSV